MFVKVNHRNIEIAAEIHSLSWRASHKTICSEEELKQHTVLFHKQYFKKGISEGKNVYILMKNKPVGVVSVKENFIEDLYVLPDEQHKGYGTELLHFAIKQCKGIPCLCVLETNEKAQSLYYKIGFTMTGNKFPFSKDIYELEMKLIK